MICRHVSNLFRRTVLQIPFSLLLNLVILCLLVQINAQQHVSTVNRQCEEIYDQIIDEISLRNLFQSSVLSSMSYLEYEKDSTLHPWKIDFESTGPEITAGFIRTMLQRKACEVHLFLRKSYRIFYKILSSIPLLRSVLKTTQRSGVTHGDMTSKHAIRLNDCFAKEKIVENFKLRWFFADWREGVWHDTEVLLGESENIAVVVFRGSDTAADLFTNSQTMEAASHSFYFGPQEGSLHRGILNAYGRVDRGKLIALDRGIDKNSCFGSAVGDTFDHFKRIQNLLKESGIVNNSKNISKILINGKNDLKVNNNNNNDNDNNKNVGKNSDDEGNNNVGDIRSGRGGNSSSSSSNNNSDKKKSASSSVDDNSVPVIDTLLSNLLINSVLSALKAGKRVIVSGHSLGGSLALLLTLDIVVNHIEQVEDIEVEKEREVSKTSKVKSMDRQEEKIILDNEEENISMNSKISKENKEEKGKEKGEKVKEKGKEKKGEKEELEKQKLEAKKKTRQKELHCGSYSHHKGRRCTGIANPAILNNLYVITFGQPELADSSFFESVKERSPAAKSLLTHRYLKCISLAQAPSCDADIITQLVSKVGNVIGDWLSGINKYKKVRKKSVKEINGHDQSEIFLDLCSDSNSSSNLLDKSTDLSDEVREIKDLSNAKEIHSGDRHTGTKKVRREKNKKQEQERKGKERKTLKHKKKAYFFEKRKQEKDEISSKESSLENETIVENGNGSERQYNGGAGKLIYVCSGSSKDNIDAHRMNHYIHGIEIMASTYDRKLKTSDGTSHSVLKSKKGKKIKDSASKRESHDADHGSQNIDRHRNSKQSTNVSTEHGSSDSSDNKMPIILNGFPSMVEDGSKREKENLKKNIGATTNNKITKKESRQNTKRKPGKSKKKESSKNRENSSFSRKEKNVANQHLLQINESENGGCRNGNGNGNGNEKRNGISLKTNMKLESALNLNLISLEKYKKIMKNNEENSEYSNDLFYTLH